MQITEISGAKIIYKCHWNYSHFLCTYLFMIYLTPLSEAEVK
jgi:hypothetical protein